jgi:hypothetical protein
MRYVIFSVVLQFEDEVNDVKSIAKNIVNSLSDTCESGAGLAPEDSDTFTTDIQVAYNGLILASSTLTPLK